MMHTSDKAYDAYIYICMYVSKACDKVYDEYMYIYNVHYIHTVYTCVYIHIRSKLAHTNQKAETCAHAKRPPSTLICPDFFVVFFFVLAPPPNKFSKLPIPPHLCTRFNLEST